MTPAPYWHRWQPANEILFLREMVEAKKPRAWWLGLLRQYRNRRWNFAQRDVDRILEFVENVLRYRDHA
jgi:hypothetical protein